jgi:hypothetical protein
VVDWSEKISRLVPNTTVLVPETPRERDRTEDIVQNLYMAG